MKSVISDLGVCSIRVFTNSDNPCCEPSLHVVHAESFCMICDVCMYVHVCACILTVWVTEFVVVIRFMSQLALVTKYSHNL